MKNETSRIIVYISIFVLLNPGQVGSKLKFVDSQIRRLPLTHIKADLRIRNYNVHRMVEIIFSYLSPVLIANRLATCL